MVGFQRKEISNSPNIGERLKNCRQQKGISLERAAKLTRISPKYLNAIEAGDYHKLPGEIYAKNFIKVYSEFLGLSSKKFLAVLQSEYQLYTKTKDNSDIIRDLKKPVKRVSKAHLIVAPKIIKGILIGLFALACFVYLGVKVKGVLTPPILSVEQPANNFVTENDYIDVVGQTETEAVLEINGQQVMLDEKGNFRTTIDLQEGANLIEIKVEKRHGRVTKIFRQVVVNKEDNLEGENN